MIEFHFETDFRLTDTKKYHDWIQSICKSEGCHVGELNYIFCSDSYLLNINQKYLHHDTFTDIITFDYTEGNAISGDIYISVERVKENKTTYQVTFKNELLRVMSHGVLHLLGYKDKNEEDVLKMRLKEEEKIKMFHVEH